MFSPEEVAFLIFAAIAIAGAIGCVYARRVAHSLLSLMMTFLAVAGVFILAEAEMLAEATPTEGPRVIGFELAARLTKLVIT